MKKLLATAIVAALIASLGAAFASLPERQLASHDVTIGIPSVLMIRITTDTGSNAAADNPAVNFDFTSGAGLTAYLTAIESGGGIGTLEPTSFSNFGDVRVLANRTWQVTVSATPLTFEPLSNSGNVAADLHGITRADISVDPSAGRVHLT